MAAWTQPGRRVIPGEGAEVGWFESGDRSSQELNCSQTCLPRAPPSDDPILTLAFYLLSVRSEFSSSTLLWPSDLLCLCLNCSVCRSGLRRNVFHP